MVNSPAIGERATSQNAPGTTIVGRARLQYPPADDRRVVCGRLSTGGGAFKDRRTHVPDRGVTPALVVEPNNETPIVPSRGLFATAGTRGSTKRCGCIKRGVVSGRANPSFAVA